MVKFKEIFNFKPKTVEELHICSSFDNGFLIFLIVGFLMFVRITDLNYFNSGFTFAEFYFCSMFFFTIVSCIGYCIGYCFIIARLLKERKKDE